MYKYEEFEIEIIKKKLDNMINTWKKLNRIR